MRSRNPAAYSRSILPEAWPYVVPALLTVAIPPPTPGRFSRREANSESARRSRSRNPAAYSRSILPWVSTDGLNIPPSRVTFRVAIPPPTPGRFSRVRNDALRRRKDGHSSRNPAAYSRSILPQTGRAGGPDHQAGGRNPAAYSRSILPWPIAVVKGFRKPYYGRNPAAYSRPLPPPAPMRASAAN